LLALARALALAGGVLLATAAALWLVARLGANHLPGTVVVRRGSFTLFAPVGVWILVSVVLTLVLNIVARLLR
jgi:hypothetical protein